MNYLIQLDPTAVRSHAWSMADATAASRRRSVHHEADLAMHSAGWVGDSLAALQELRTCWEAQNVALHTRAEAMAQATIGTADILDAADRRNAETLVRVVETNPGPRPGTV